MSKKLTPFILLGLLVSCGSVRCMKIDSLGELHYNTAALAAIFNAPESRLSLLPKEVAEFYILSYIIFPNNADYTPLHIAAYLGYDLTELLQSETDVNKLSTSEGYTPLHLAAMAGNTRGIAQLLIARADLNKLSKYGYTPLHLAAMRGHTQAIEQLLIAGADIARKVDLVYRGETALILAAEHGQVAAVEKLLEKGAPVDDVDNFGRTALHHAVRNLKSKEATTRLEVVKKLLSANANVNCRDADDQTALHRAAANGDTSIATLLLASGANVNERVCKIDGMPTDVAIARFHNMRILYDIHAQLKAKIGLMLGLTPLHAAAQNGQCSMVELLLSAGATVDLANTLGQSTALHFAIKNGHGAVVTQLLRAGAAINTADSSGDTALHLAVQKGNTEVVQELLQAGANKNTINKNGFTPAGLASNKEHTPLMDLLR